MSYKIMLDTNIYDKLEVDVEFKKKLQKLIQGKKIILLSTHIQRDEMPDHLQNDSSVEELPTNGFVLGVSRLDQAKLGNGKKYDANIEPENIPTAGGIWDVSRWDEATWGDGSSSGISVNDIKTSSGKHARDALIATTRIS